VTFSSTGIGQKGNDLKIDGFLTFHGIKKWISINATLQEIEKQLIVKGSFPILMTDYNVERPSFMMVKTDNKIDMEFSVALTK
jgi:polyisoprenoid-binding protein YceI